MTLDDDAWIPRADVSDATRGALGEAHRRLRRARKALGLAPEPDGGVRAWLRAIRRRLAPGGRRRALEDLAAGLAAAVEAAERAAEWQQARVVHLTALVEGLARRAPPRPWRGRDERPVLCLGTGGGGTRVLAETAVRLGVHLGATVNESFDSVAWAPLVYDLVRAHGGAVDLPFADAAPDADGARARVLALAEALHAPWAAEGAPFGWKLPEFLLVLPILFDAFPNARAVLLVRHPVAAALRRPHVTTMPDHPLGRVVLAAAYRAAGRDPADVAADPPHVRQALAWRHQLGRAVRFLEARIAPAQRLVLRLEDFALSPEATVARLASFVGAPVAPTGALAPFDAARAAPPRDAAAAARVRDLCADVAATVGYGPGWLDAPVERAERRAWFTGLA